MLHFFTDPYPGEIISSVCARYHYYSGNINNKHTLVELFGKDTVRAFKVFPARLNYLVKQLDNKAYTCDYFINKHTIFPFYSPFISKSRQLKVVNFMKFEGHSAIYNTLGISTSSINTKQGYKYCPKCISDDIKRFGEGYFHRVHQLQGILVCPKHGSSLLEYDAGIEANSSFIRLNSNKINFKESIVYEGQVSDELLMIGKAADYVLTLPYLSHDVHDVRKRLMYFLNKKNYLTHGGIVRQEKLLEDFLVYFSSKVLELLNSQIINDRLNWIRNITQNNGKIVHPIRNILLILFLTNNDIEMFFEVKLDDDPFGKGPWPCLNVAAEHYLQKVVNKCEIQKSYRSTVPKGIFRCTCGYVYSRKGPDKSLQDMFRIDKVLERGVKWEAKFRKCLEESNYNIRHTSNLMKCSEYQVSQYIKNNWFRKPIKLGEDRKKDRFNEYSNEIINYIRVTPNCTREDIYVNFKKQVSWFRRNNPEWMNRTFPASRQKEGTTNYKIDYEELDKRILSSVKIAYDELILLDVPKRITVTIIEKFLNVKIQRHIKKLPKTKEYLDQILETIDDFRIRRVKKYCDRLIKNEIRLSPTQIFERASIVKRKISNVLLQQINEIIDDYTINVYND